MTSAMASASDQHDDQHKRRVFGRPFEKGVSQTAKFAKTRRQMQDEVIADLEAGGRKVVRPISYWLRAMSSCFDRSRILMSTPQ